MIFTGLVIILILQRLYEMKIGKEHLREISHETLVSLSVREKFQMIILHGSFFISCLLEYHFRGQLMSLPILIPIILLLILTQYLRFKTIRLLGIYWTPYPLSFKGQTITYEGPYRIIRHPNYLAVVLEIALVPLAGSCYFTSITFSLLNFIFLKRRMDTEEIALHLLPQYELGFSGKKRLIPYIY